MWFVNTIKLKGPLLAIVHRKAVNIFLYVCYFDFHKIDIFFSRAIYVVWSIEFIYIVIQRTIIGLSNKLSHRQHLIRFCNVPYNDVYTCGKPTQGGFACEMVVHQKCNCFTSKKLKLKAKIWLCLPLANSCPNVFIIM